MSIILENVSYTYMPGTPYQRDALRNISLTVELGEFIGIIGHTGSGKSTLVQHLNGLLKPSAGKIELDGTNLHGGQKDFLKKVRQKVGMVFQYPEHQLFEETVFEDVAFGPRNLGLNREEIASRVETALQSVGLPVDEFAERSPFRLSGGQMRRVAIAGVLALQPQYLVLDEPSAGLDPQGRDEIYDQILKLYVAGNITVVLVTHNMEDVARMAGRLLVINHGELEYDGPPRDLFHNQKVDLNEYGVGLPPITSLVRTLAKSGFPIDETLMDAEEVSQAVYKKICKQGGLSC